MRSITLYALCLSAFVLAACQTPELARREYSDAEIANEGLQQEINAVKAEIRRTKRLRDITAPLLEAALPLCGEDWTAPSIGTTMHSLDSYRVDAHDIFIEGFQLGYRPQLWLVEKGSAAEKAGVLPGDEIMMFQGVETTGNAGALAKLFKDIEEWEKESKLTTAYRFRRNGQEFSVNIQPRNRCDFGVYVIDTGVANAYADGRSIRMEATMMRLMSDDHIRTIMAHEMAHNVMSHLEKAAENRAMGQAAGFALDLLFAFGGVSTNFNQIGKSLGNDYLSPEFEAEAEADVVGMYILGMAGYPVRNAAEVWRRMSEISPGSIYAESTHPPNAERTLTLKAVAREIEVLRKTNQEIYPPLPEGWTPRRKPKPVSAPPPVENRDGAGK